MNSILIENLSHRFPDGTLALDNVNLTIEGGSFVVFAGPNGSGKTTLFRHLNGLLTPSRGRIALDGIDVSADPRRARQQVGMVFQDADSQIVGETVYDDAAFGPENLGWTPGRIRRKALDALSAVGLSTHEDRRPHQLSGGEKRRLAIAGVLAMNPQVIVFDEPFSNLDYTGVCQVLEQMQALHQSGHTLLVSTHDLEKVIAHAQRLILMAAGRIVQDGIPAELLERVENYGVRAPCGIHVMEGCGSWLNP